MLLAMIIVVALVGVGVTTISDTTYSQDDITVATTADGEQVKVTYEISRTTSSDLNQGKEQELMQNMQIVSSCSNEKLDSYIESHDYDEVRSANLNSTIGGCEEYGIESKVLIVGQPNDVT